MHRMQGLLAVLVASVLFASTADAFELLMFRRAGCSWCGAWDREIGPLYARTDVGQRIPVRHVDLDRDDVTQFKLSEPIRFTPTFVLVEGNREIARIEGYPGEDFFWARLERLIPSAMD
jgi:thioredoxin-related protein